MTKLRGRRALKACRFCRQRKIKCDNRQPSCNACDVYGKSCIYEDLPRRARPSRSRITQLEEENDRLKRSLVASLQSQKDMGNSRPISSELPEAHPSHGHKTSLERGVVLSKPQSSFEVPTSSAHPPPCLNDNEGATPTVNYAQRDAVESRFVMSVEGEPRYHGPTSTLFEDGTGDRRVQQNVSSLPKISNVWVQKGLMAEAACQRHLEIINLRENKLDFDGVDPDLGMHLLNLHWNRQHHAFLITYRPAFMRDMACKGPYFSRLLLNAIYFGASKFSSRLEVRRDPNDVRTAGWLYRERVRELLGGALDRSDITTIQALLVMASSLFALGDERSAAWLYAGTAFRMIIDLGMHVDGARLSNYRKFTDEDLEIRRRVFWGAFVVDKIQSLYQGRPVSLQEQECSTSISFLDHYEELEHWKPDAYSTNQSHPGCPAYSVSTFTELCKLSLIMNRILNKVYGERSSKRTPTELAEDLKSLHANLDQWHNDLPSHLSYDPSNTSLPIPPPNVLSLLAMHNVLLILLHRPFVSDGDLHLSPSNAINSFLVCATAAKTIVHILSAYDAAYSIRRAPYLISYATYVSATIHVRIAAQREPGSEAHVCLARCLDVFKKNQETNWAVKRANVIIQNLMKRMNVGITENDIAGDLQTIVRSDDNNNDDNNHLHRSERTAASGHKNNVSNNNNNQIPHQSSHVTARSENADSVLNTYDAGTAEHVASDLDIDAIIQSFIREQQRKPQLYTIMNNNNNKDEQQPILYSASSSSSSQQQMAAANQWYHPSTTTPSSVHDDMAIHNPQSMQNFPPDYAGGGADYEQQTSLLNLSVDDMLFGFNSSEIEGIGWEFDGRMS